MEAFFGAVLDYGVAFETHAQNVLARIDRTTGQIKGWAVRDLDSSRVHLPTLAKSGYRVYSTMRGGENRSLVGTDDEVETWKM